MSRYERKALERLRLAESDWEPGSRRRQSVRGAGRRRPLFEELSARVVSSGVRPEYGSLGSEGSPARMEWRSLPGDLDPVRFMERGRALRKRQQVENMVGLVEEVLRRSRGGLAGKRVVDFCSGSGHTGLVLAYRLQEHGVRVALVEKNAFAAERARERVGELGLANVEVKEKSILECGDEEFDAAVAVHACGMLSDIALLLSVRRGAAFVVAPCCVGKVENMCHGEFGKEAREKLGVSLEEFFPRSDTVRRVMTEEEFFQLARRGDCSRVDGQSERRMCKALVETDRLMYATEQGYETWLVKMNPPECTPKNDILVGLRKV